MAWYKIAKDFNERNLINYKIAYLKDIKNRLSKLSKLIFQSGSLTKKANFAIIQDKKISSYPLIRDILINADNVALDSPWRFAAFCNDAIGVIDKKIYAFRKEREEITRIEKGQPQKGWI